MHILEELFYGLRYVSFSEIQVSDQGTEPVDAIINRIITNWPQYIEQELEKEYLSRLNEYCQILESPAESRTAVYPKRILLDLNWIKRLFFLPYYKFESFSAPTIHKLDIPALYSEVHTLKRCLTAIAASIDKAKKAGGAGAHVSCNGINNPWDPYLSRYLILSLSEWIPFWAANIQSNGLMPPWCTLPLRSLPSWITSSIMKQLGLYQRCRHIV